MKRYDEALDNAEQAVAMDPSLILAYETLAQIYEETGRSEEATKAMGQAETLRQVRQ